MQLQMQKNNWNATSRGKNIKIKTDYIFFVPAVDVSKNSNKK